MNYTWGDNGNLLDDGAKTYAYDHSNRLTLVDDGQASYSYAYNGLGDRMQQTTGGNTTNYLLDTVARLSQVLGDGSNSYLYGMGRIAQYDTSGAQYFLADGLGSVRQMADTEGVVTLATGYEPYGEVLDSTGNGMTSYGFTGEWTDSTGLIYLRARHYAPGLGRFLQADPFSGIPAGPQSFNGYSYAMNNPVRYLDASGECPPCWLLILLGLALSGCTGGPSAEPTPSPIGPSPTPGELFDGYVAILACGINAGNRCENTKDYGGLGSLSPIKKRFEDQEGETIMMGIDGSGGEKEGSKEKFAGVIKAKIDEKANATGIFLVGHSAGADAVVWGLSQRPQSTAPIKAIVLLDPSLLLDGGTRGDTVANGNELNNNYNLFVAYSKYYWDEYYEYNTQGVGLPQADELLPNADEDHLGLAVNEHVAKWVIKKFEESILP